MALTTELITTTLRRRSREIADAAFNAHVLLAYLRDRKRTIDGGTTILEPVMYASNATVKSYSGYDELETSTNQVISSSEWSPFQIAGTYSISGREMSINRGDAEVIDLLKAREHALIMSLRDEISTELFATTKASSTDIDGVGTTIAATPTTGTVGGINRATDAWWRNKYNTSVGAGAAITFASDGRLYMAKMFNACSQGPGVDHPDLIITDETTYEGYEGLLVDKLRYMDKTVGDFSFTGFNFKGQLLTFDRKCTSGYMYFINSAYLRLVVYAGKDVYIGNLIEPTDQDAFTAKVLWMGNLVGSNYIRQGVLTGISV